MGRGLLLLVSGFLIIFGMVQNSVQNRQQVLSERSPAYYHEEQSRNIAASMMEVALAKYNENPYWSGDKSNQIMGGEGIISVDSTAAFGSRVYLSIQGIVESNDTRTTTTIKALANRPAFSIYSYFTSEEPSHIAFGSGDTLNGPVHTNGTFHMRGDPVFNGHVTSPNEYEDVSDYGNSDPTFEKGANFNADEIELDPAITDDIPQNAQNGGLRFDDDKIKVEFNEDGTVDITQYQQTGTEDVCVRYCNYHEFYRRYETRPTYDSGVSNPQYNPYSMNSSNFNGIISSAGNVEVRGKVKGNITLHSEQNIEIIGDVVYEDYDPSNPTAKLSSNNLLGIVSEGDITVDENAHENGYDSSQNLNITASVMAMGKSFSVEKYNSGSHRGQLRILGGLIQQERGAVGTSGGTGYDKLYSYDERLLENSTPDFPKVKRFQIESWRETTEQAPLN